MLRGGFEKVHSAAMQGLIWGSPNDLEEPEPAELSWSAGVELGSLNFCRFKRTSSQELFNRLSIKWGTSQELFGTTANQQVESAKVG